MKLYSFRSSGVQKFSAVPICSKILALLHLLLDLRHRQILMLVMYLELNPYAGGSCCACSQLLSENSLFIWRIATLLPLSEPYVNRKDSSNYCIHIKRIIYRFCWIQGKEYNKDKYLYFYYIQNEE